MPDNAWIVPSYTGLYLISSWVHGSETILTMTKNTRPPMLNASSIYSIGVLFLMCIKYTIDRIKKGKSFHFH